jgi:hypothetical protein
MKAPITSAQAMSHPTVVETINTLGGIAVELRAELETVRADERRFIAEKWENWYGYDKEGVAEFIRKRANTQGEQDE